MYVPFHLATVVDDDDGLNNFLSLLSQLYHLLHYPRKQIKRTIYRYFSFHTIHLGLAASIPIIGFVDLCSSP